jgi:hypothetical protein
MNGAWAASDHRFGKGKVHSIDDRDSTRLLCGHLLTEIPGRPSTAAPNCKTCLKAIKTRQARADYAVKAEERQRLYRQRKEQENREWWERYNQYLLSPEWAQRRALVMLRAGGLCEGCMIAPATQVHHLSYKHVFEEFLWELRAACNACHERAHQDKRRVYEH